MVSLSLCSGSFLTSLRAQPQTPEASVRMSNVKVCDRMIRKSPNKCGLFRRAEGESLFSPKRTWQHGLGLQICIWMNQAEIWPKLGHQQDNDPKHRRKSSTEWLKKKWSQVHQESSQSTELTQTLWESCKETNV